MLETAISLSALDAYGMFQRLSGRAEIPSQQQKYIPQSCLNTALSTVNASRPLDAHPTPLTRQSHARDQYLRFCLLYTSDAADDQCRVSISVVAVS